MMVAPLLASLPGKLPRVRGTT